MTAWTQASAIEWCRRHAGRRVILRQQGSTLLLAGQLHGVDEIDACSTDVYDAELNLDQGELQAHLSLHETTLVVHLLSHAAAGDRLSIPLSIPYAELLLAEPAAAEPADSAPSPYELLR